MLFPPISSGCSFTWVTLLPGGARQLPKQKSNPDFGRGDNTLRQQESTKQPATGACKGMFRRRQQTKILLCFYCNTPSTIKVEKNVPLRKWFCHECEQTNHLDEVFDPPTRRY